MKKVIHYVLILDQSGSMYRLKDEVISSFNEQVEMIYKLKKNEPEVDLKVTLCIFNDTVNFKFVNCDIDQLTKLTAADYQPGSFTALYDAMGISFMKINEIVRPNDSVFFAIFTDGLENASENYTANDIKHKLKEADKNEWTVRFFLRYEDSIFYKRNLDLSESKIFNISLNKSGLSEINNEIAYCMESIMKFDKNVENE
jgi:hypothetical protein